MTSDPGFGNRWDDCGYCLLAPSMSGWARGTQISCPVHGSQAQRGPIVTTSTTPTVDDLTQAIRDELVQLWGDLASAVRYAHGGCWSVQCENVADRITALSRLVGPTGWGHIDVTLLKDGVYERVHREAGIEVSPIDWERVNELDAQIRAEVAAARAR